MPVDQYSSQSCTTQKRFVQWRLYNKDMSLAETACAIEGLPTLLHLVLLLLVPVSLLVLLLPAAAIPLVPTLLQADICVCFLNTCEVWGR